LSAAGQGPLEASTALDPKAPLRDASRFVAWTGGKARIQWINTTGQPSNNPCNAQGAHGFFKQDGPAVSAIISFVKSH